MPFNCTAIDTSALANSSDLEDEPAAIPQHDDGNTSTHDNDDNNSDGDTSTHENDENNDNNGNDGDGNGDADANGDKDNQDNAVAGPTILAHVEMAKTTRKYILKFL
jgi:hypothetical protein